MKYPAKSSTQNWWDTAIAGIVTIIFGLLALFWPTLTLMILLILFAAFVIVFGIAKLIGTYRASRIHTSWWPSLIVGVLSIAAGLVVFFWPGLTTFVLLFVIAFWAIAVGITEAISGILVGRWLLALLGAITLVFGLILLANPFTGALGVVMLIGVFAIVRGIILVIEAFQIPAAAGTPS